MENGTADGANTASPAITADALTSPVNDGFNRIDPTVDNVSDIDGPPVKAGSDQDAAKAAEGKAAQDKAEADKGKDLESRFDKHPRFKELETKIHTLTEQLAAAEGKISVLTPQNKADIEKKDDDGLPYKDITAMSKEELLEWQEDDPKGYAANLYQQIYHEVSANKQAEETRVQRENSVNETYSAFEKEHSDFREKWDSGELKMYMQEHPGHNAMSAYMALNKGNTQAQIDAAVAKAVKEAEERVTKNFQAKRNAEVISDAGTTKTDEVADELKNPQKYGGPVSVGALRLLRMRQASAGG